MRDALPAAPFPFRSVVLPLLGTLPRLARTLTVLTWWCAGLSIVSRSPKPLAAYMPELRQERRRTFSVRKVPMQHVPMQSLHQPNVLCTTRLSKFPSLFRTAPMSLVPSCTRPPDAEVQARSHGGKSGCVRRQASPTARPAHAPNERRSISRPSRKSQARTLSRSAQST
ncbi:hypothetical protein BDY21DRAFT_338461 [Lineolata rhizophorae]|uniref:Uncharacterized protein n=1 Tax=Lineolata rhizophorae TaxID=578093 RepID=A0A6A6P692_9PEZI|nr:hypothetical protein BDY21DRAFT_338461 [Lineolata rhizophorae]